MQEKLMRPAGGASRLPVRVSGETISCSVRWRVPAGFRPTRETGPPPMALPDLKRAPLGERLQDPLLVLEVEQKTFGDKDCTVLTLGNATGRLVTAPFWGADQLAVAGIARSDVVQVIAEVDQFRGRRQLKVSSIRPLPRGSIDRRQLLPSVGDVAPYWKR